MKDKRKFIFLFIFAFLYLILFLVFYPSMYSTMDERTYLLFAYRIINGHLTFDPLTPVVFGLRKTSAGIITIYLPGNSLLLIPFLKLNWLSVFLRGLIFSLAGFFIFYKILQKENTGFPELWAGLFLFYPPFILYSRTIMSDMPSMFFILAGYYFFRDKNYLISGFLNGFSIFIRLNNIIFLIPFFVFLLIEILKKREKFISFFIFSIFPFLFFLLCFIYYFWAFGNPFHHPLAGEESWNFRFFLKNFLFYFTAFNIFYPFLFILFIIALLFEKYSSLKIINIFVLLNIFLICFYGYHFEHPNIFLNSLVGLRLLLIGVPFMLIYYIRLLEKVFPFYNFFLLLLINLILSGGAGFLSYKHSNYLNEYRFYRNLIYENTEENSLIIGHKEVTKLINEPFGKRDYIHFADFGNLLPLPENLYLEKRRKYIIFLGKPFYEYYNQKTKEVFFQVIEKYSKNLRLKFSLEKPREFYIYEFIP